jgi:hypothetical protein
VSSIVSANRREVVEHLLQLEVGKGDIEAERLISRANMNDDEFFRGVRDYAERHKKAEGRILPVLVWTVGLDDDNRHISVQRWYRTDIHLGKLYSNGIGLHTKDDLDSVQGNMRLFAAIVQANPGRYPEFNLARTPKSEYQRTLIGIVRHTPRCLGEIELIDGAHRTVSMLANGTHLAPAYLAELH